MKKLFASLSILLSISSFAERPVPSPVLSDRLADRSLEVFGIVHWGPNTFTDREWGYGDEDPKCVNPDAFDARQIAAAAKAGGLGGLVVVAKHHDGFCLWPTKTTEHNISKSPFRSGKGDYVKEMSEACRAEGIKFGVYCSPWDRNNADYATDKYIQIYRAQLRELLGGAYGEVFEMWFDNANGGTGYYGGAREKRTIPMDYYDFPSIFKFVRTLQPKVTIFNEDDSADFRWPGNEQGYVDPVSRATVRSYDPHTYKDYCNLGDKDGATFHPCEGDFPLRRGWFYHDLEKGTAKSGAYLMQRYLYTVGSGGTMNIGLAPDKHGRLCDEDVAALKEFKRIRDAFFAKQAGDGEAFNVVVLTEDLSAGEQVDEWELIADGVKVAGGGPIGVKRIKVLENPVMTASPVIASACGTRGSDILVASDKEDKFSTSGQETASPVAKDVKFNIVSAGKNVKAITVTRYFVDPKLIAEVMSATAPSGETDTAKWMTAADEARAKSASTNDTAKVQQLIDDAAKRGGGKIVLEPGVYSVGTIYLRSNIELCLKKGAVLMGSGNWQDYDDVDDPRIGKIPERSKKAFLVAIGCTNVVLSGEGVIDGQGLSFYDTNVPPGRMFAKPPHPRTRMVELVACRDVRIEGLEFKDSPGWTFWIRNCDNVTCTNLKIHGDQRMINNDGLHFDGCRHVRVSNCDIRTGDDCVIMRANRLPGGKSVCEDFVVENCRLDSNCQAIRLGCPSDDTIRNAVFRNLSITGGNGICSIHPNRYLQPGCEGYCFMENILVENCSVDVRGAAILYTVDPGIRLRRFGGTIFRDLKLKRDSKIVLNGTADSPLVGVNFESSTDTDGSVPFVRHPSDSWEAD